MSQTTRRLIHEGHQTLPEHLTHEQVETVDRALTLAVIVIVAAIVLASLVWGLAYTATHPEPTNPHQERYETEVLAS